jgi:hypothetical protein
VKIKKREKKSKKNKGNKEKTMPPHYEVITPSNKG